MKREIIIEEDRIEAARAGRTAGNPTACPLREALRSAGFHFVTADYEYWSYIPRYPDNSGPVYVKLPESVGNWLKMFDLGEPVWPIRFHVNVSARWAAAPPVRKRKTT